jgi:hypothetical protein
MLVNSDTLTEQPAHPQRRGFSFGFWIVAAGLVLCMVMLFPHSGAIIDRARRIDLEMVGIHRALESYKAAFDAFPAGDSAAVFRALRGQNPKQLVFYDCRAESVSPDGSLLDPWGTPYQVYFSGDEILIRSAGPNRKFDASSEKQFDDYIQ